MKLLIDPAIINIDDISLGMRNNKFLELEATPEDISEVIAKMESEDRIELATAIMEGLTNYEEREVIDEANLHNEWDISTGWDQEYLDIIADDAREEGMLEAPIYPPQTIMEENKATILQKLNTLPLHQLEKIEMLAFKGQHVRV